jgi:hypothetical protein
MRPENGVFHAMWRGLRAIVRRPASPDPPASREPIVVVLDIHPGSVVIESYDGNDDHDRWFHPVH